MVIRSCYRPVAQVLTNFATLSSGGNFLKTIVGSVDMSRKDTIIVTVLINAGLLVVLFASALKTSEVPQEKVAAQMVREQIEMPKPKLERKPEPTPVVVAKPKPVEKPVAVAPLKPAPAPKSAQTIVVQNGDALEKIARRHGVTVSALMQANDLSSSSLKIGQELLIP